MIYNVIVLIYHEKKYYVFNPKDLRINDLN